MARNPRRSDPTGSYKQRVEESDAYENIAGMIPGLGTAMTVSDIEDELKKDKPDYFKIGLLAGTEAIGLIPGLGTAAKSMIRKGADMARQTDNVVDVASNVPKVAKEPFKKTRPAYKLFIKSEDEKLYPLFVNASDEIPVNQWLEADFPDVAFKGKTQKGGEGWYVPTKGAKRTKGEKAKATGDRIVIPDEETRQKLIDAGFITEKTGRTKDAPYGKVTAVAARPGFHSSVNPVAEHLGPQDIKVSKAEADKLIESGINPKAIRRRGDQYYVKRRAEDQYWAEVEMADDTSDELRAYMQAQGRTDINDKVPKGGSYSYVDGQADGDTWVVGGDMKIKKVLTREEAKAAQEAAGVKDLPYRDEVEAILGRKFAEGGLVGEDMYAGQQDYLLAASSGIEMNEGGAVPDNTVGVDPVSGNEVPIGSLPEEVRDDIPAQLSEGEYVVPADVVRYYGVKFFEDLRAEAKQGWASMEANGRVGGEPVEATGMEMGQDELPFDISELQVVEMNEGGFLGGYDEGGSVTTTSLTGSPFATNKVTTKKYVDGQGNVRYVTFSGDTPLSYIPPEFKEEGTEEAAPTTTTEAAPAPVQQDDGPDIDYDYYESLRREANKFNPETAAFEDYQKELDKASGKAGSVIAGGIASIGLGPIAGIGISKLIDNENRKRLENLRDATENKVSELQGSSTTVDQVSPYADLLTDINNILEGKETEQPKSIAELLGFASKNETGVPSENKGVFSSMLDNIKTSLSEATSWDDDKWKKTGLSEEFSTLKGRDPNRSALWGSEQEALAGAIRSGNDDVVRHYEIINEHRKAAERYRQGKSTGSTFLSKATMDRIDKEEAEKKKKNK